MAGIESFGCNYNQIGLVASVLIASTDNYTAWQRFLPSGPIALLPLDSTHSSLVWSLTREAAGKVAKLPTQDLVHLVNAAFRNPVEDVDYLLSQIAADGSTGCDYATQAAWGRARSVVEPPHEDLPEVSGSGVVSCFSLRLHHAASYDSPGVALVGYLLPRLPSG